MITIHFDFTDGTEVSYAEGLLLEDNFTTNCLDFFQAERDAKVVKKNGFYLHTKELLQNKTNRQHRYIRKAHNFQRMLKADTFVWSPPAE